MAAVRRISTLGPVATVAELEPSLTVGEHLRERGLLLRGFGRRAAARDRSARALAAAGLDPEALPTGPRTVVRDLERPAALRLGVALALMSGPAVLGVDDADLGLGPADRADVWAMLRDVAASGPTVLAVCAEAPAGTDLTVRLTAPAAAVPPPAHATAEAPAQAPAEATKATEAEQGEGGAADAHAEARRV
jgi:ABC-type polar amino acid transport system ATPase subunit